MADKKHQVLFTGTSYPVDENDWRGRFIANIIKAFSNNSSINMCVWVPDGKLPSNTKNLITRKEGQWLEWLMKTGGIAHIIRTRGPLAAGTIGRLLFYLKRLYKNNHNIDIVHINWLQNAIPLWGSSTPAVISVLGSDFGLLKLPGMTALLRTVIRQRKCTITPNADWMVPALEKAFGDIAKIKPVPFGVDEKWFNIKRNFNINRQTTWLAVTRLTKAKLGPIFDWGENYFRKDNIFHLFGPMQEEIKLPDWVIYHGPVSPEDLQNKWFKIATGLLTLSQHDEGRPQVMLEAMASGLPVIASDLKAHTDIIQHNKTGCIVNSHSEFVESLSFLSNPDNNTKTGINARSWVKNNIGTWDDCTKRYISIYEKLLTSNS